MATNSTIYTRTDLRDIADRARIVHEGTTDPILRARAEAVEDLLRAITGDAAGTLELAQATLGAIPHADFGRVSA